MSKIAVTVGNCAYEIEFSMVHPGSGTIPVKVNGELIEVALPGMRYAQEGNDWLVIDNRPYEITFDRDLRWVQSELGTFPIEIRDRESLTNRPLASDGRIKAPIPGLITQVLVSEGERVELGQPLFILEAMKMENELRATQAGIVQSISVSLGQGVSLHELLAEII
jgi:biotin carboxyl carrier protein